MLTLLLLLAPSDGLPFPAEGRMVPVAAQPDFAGRPGEWDAAIRERGWIVQEGDRYRMWYTGYDGTRGGLKRVGHAVSEDGLNWRREPGGSITPDGLWCEDVQVVPHDGVYHMFAEGRGDVAHRLESSDGLAWEAKGPLDIRLSTGEPIPNGPRGTPNVVIVDGVWHLLYERKDLGIWVATSTDLQTWTNVDDEPVFRPSGRGWDGALIAFNHVFHDGERWVALYHGTAGGPRPHAWASGAAFSDDLRTWTRHGGNPLTSPSMNLSSPIAVRIPGGWRLFTTHARVDALRPATAATGN